MQAEMNWPLILGYLKALIWPLLVGALVFKFRGQLGGWLARPPSAIQLPGGSRIEWPEQQLALEEPDPEEALAPYEDQDFVEALREEVRQEVAQDAEQDRRAVVEHFVREQVNLQLALEFERVLNRIFGSQIRLLEWISGAGGSLAGEGMASYFAAAQQATPALLEWTLDQYLQFLVNNGLLRVEADRYVLTDKGQAFLGYMRTNGYVSGMRLL
jgi:hypothetical protein